MKKLLLWNKDRELGSWLVVKPEEVEQVVCAPTMNVYSTDITDYTDELIDRLNQELEAFEDEDEDEYEKVKRVLERAGLDSGDVVLLPEVTPIEEVIVYDSYNEEFSDFSYWDISFAFQYWDGGNWKWVFMESEIEIEIDESTEECLDVWDGSNWTSGSMGRHEYLYEIPDEGRYLIIESSQWEGELDAGYIMTEDEVIKHLEETDRGEVWEEIQKEED